MEKKDQKIIKYKRPFNINAGMIIFIILIIYIISVVIISLMKKPVSVAEVQSGRIVDSSVFTGIAIRKEYTVESPTEGYLNYYINDGSRVAKNKPVCMIDTTGSYTSGIMENSDIQFSNDDLREIEQIISVYSNSYSNSRFNDIYSFKYNLQNKMTEIISNQTITSLESKMGSNSNTVKVYAPESGIVTYSYDGMETLTADQITDDMFNYGRYRAHQITSSEKVEAGSPAYKLTTDTQWSIIIKLNETQATVLSKEKVIKIKFTKDDISTWAYVNIFTNGESSYAELSISRYMIRYISDRYIDIELVTAEQEGLKISATSVVSKDFYTIPQDYLVVEENTNEKGFYRYYKDANNQTKIEFVKPTIYKQENGLCYVELHEFTLGDYIGDGVSEENQYRIGPVETLNGVYNINQGYAVFRLVDIIYQNNDYCIIKSGTNYGVSLYDHIVLNAEAVNEDEIIY